MSDQDRAASDSNEEPLFVLKYQSDSVSLRIVLCCSFICIVGIAAFVGLQNRSGVVLLLGGLAFAFLIIQCGVTLLDIILFEEIRLYADRIVKVWRWIGETEIELADAMMRVAGGFSSGKCIFKQGTWVSFRPFSAIGYWEGLADREDVTTLNSLLATLSGRTISELERRYCTQRLIKPAKAE